MHRGRVAPAIGSAFLVACAAPPPYSVRIVDAHGDPLPLARRDGRIVVSARPGQDYGIEVTNRTAQTVAVVPSVDGLALGGRAASFTQEGIPRSGPNITLLPHTYTTIDGFDISAASTSTFRFVDTARAYARGVLPSPESIGTLEVRFFTAFAAKPGEVAASYAQAHAGTAVLDGDNGSVGHTSLKEGVPVYGELKTHPNRGILFFTTTAESRLLARFFFTYEGPGTTKLGTAGPPPSPAPASTASPPASGALAPPSPSEAEDANPMKGAKPVKGTAPTKGVKPPKDTAPRKDTKPQEPVKPALALKAPKPGKASASPDAP